MKSLAFFFLIASLIIQPSLYGQVITELVDFNSYTDSSHNDLQRDFCYINQFTQTSTNGITGGALVPNSSGSGVYHHYYLNGVTTTGICFKFDSSLVNYNGGLSMSVAASIRLDANSTIFANLGWLYPGMQLDLSVNGLTSWDYSNQSNNSPYLTLIDGHWYKLQLTTSLVSSTLVFLADSVFDLGTDGLSAPAFVKADTGTVNDSYYCTSPTIVATLGGGTLGGATYMDDFVFQGVRDPADSCKTSLTGISAVSTLNDIQFHPNPIDNELVLNYSFYREPVNPRLIISNVLGQQLKTIQLDKQSDNISINVDDLPSGTLIVNLLSENSVSVNKKIVKN